MLAAVAQDGLSLHNASKRLKEDFGVVMAAVQEDGRALQYAAAELKSDADIVYAAVDRCPEALHHVAEPFRGNPQIVLSALVSYGYTGKTNGDINDFDSVQRACNGKGLLQYSSETLLADCEAVLCVAARDTALRYPGAALRTDSDYLTIQYATEEALMWCAIHGDGPKSDREIVLAQVQRWQAVTARLGFSYYTGSLNPMID